MERQPATKVKDSPAHANTIRKQTPASSRHPLLGLQQSIGNQAVQRLINSPYIQAKLQVSTPGDPFEQEADRVADRVMRMAEPGPVSSCSSCANAGPIQRACAECEAKKHTDDDHTVQIVHRKAEPEPLLDQDDSSVASNINALNGGGSSLPETTRTFFESRFRTDFRQVRVHTGAIAAEAARSINAKAFTLGRNIAFASGQYAPESNEGRRLLAHELVHTIQQGVSTPSFGRPTTSTANQIQRQPAKTITGGNVKPESCSSSATAKGTTADDAAKMEVKPANGKPCACLVVIHNNEENARKTAELMHQHCTYNLALVNSGAATRCVDLPGHGTADFDPNAFFAPEIAEQCLNDEALCKNFLDTKKGTTDKAEIGQYVQIQFFQKLKQCSNSFSLPIVAIHNNTIDDTGAYRAAKAGTNVSDLKKDVTKGAKKDDATNLKPLRDLLEKKFRDALEKKFKGAELEKEIKNALKLLIETPGKTNIFRWCFSGEMSACHPGNPDQPDQVIWVTNKADFDRLSKTDVNVVLQDDPARVGKESKTDLSTLFLSLKDKMGTKLENEITRLKVEWLDLFKRYAGTLSQIMALKHQGASDFSNFHLIALKAILEMIYKEMVAKSTAMGVAEKEKAKFENLHYINIETPIEPLKKQTDVGRQENYTFIIGALRTLNLHCCGGKEAEAETKIKEGLVVPPAEKPKPTGAKK